MPVTRASTGSCASITVTDLPRLASTAAASSPKIAADHHHALHRQQLGDHPVGIGVRADRVDAGQRMAVARQPTRVAFGRPHEITVAERAAILERDSAPFRINRHYPCACHRRDRLLAPEGGGADEDALEHLFGREIVLGERRPLMRDFRLLADDRDRACKLALLQRNGGLRAAWPAPTIITSAGSMSASSCCVVAGTPADPAGPPDRRAPVLVGYARSYRRPAVDSLRVELPGSSAGMLRAANSEKNDMRSRVEAHAFRDGAAASWNQGHNVMQLCGQTSPYRVQATI